MGQQKQKNSARPSLVDYLNNVRVIRIIAQIVFVVVAIFSCGFISNNVYRELQNIGATPTFDYLFRRAGFAINQSPDWYSADSTYGEAFIVGVINTLQVVSVGLVLATVLGVLLGIFLLSNNWLIKNISRIYVEILRNTPLLVQLIFWYFVFWLGLPRSNIALPDESVMVVALRYFPYLIALVAVAIYAWRFDAPTRLFNGFLAGFVLAELAFWLLSDNYAIIIGLGLIGIALVVVSHRDDLIPSSYNGLAMGAGAMLLVQLVGHVLLDGLALVGLTDHPRAVWGEVDPLLILGPNLFAYPNFGITPNFLIFGIATVIGLVVAVGLYVRWGGIIERTGKDIPRTVYAVGIVTLALVIGWFAASARAIPPDLQVTVGEGEDQQTVTLTEAREGELLEPAELAVYESEAPILVQPPELNRFGTRVEVGNNLSPNYVALLVGLVIYTSAFIGEIVRAGIQAVPYGQIEASRALGLSGSQTMRMIVLPQALRVIIPPLGNQYLNLAKNSSLATAIAFSDTYQVAQTIMNQSGQSVTGFLLLWLVYITMSLVISLFMNLVNSRFQLVTR